MVSPTTIEEEMHKPGEKSQKQRPTRSLSHSHVLLYLQKMELQSITQPAYSPHCLVVERRTVVVLTRKILKQPSIIFFSFSFSFSSLPTLQNFLSSSNANAQTRHNLVQQKVVKTRYIDDSVLYALGIYDDTFKVVLGVPTSLQDISQIVCLIPSCINILNLYSHQFFF